MKLKNILEIKWFYINIPLLVCLYALTTLIIVKVRPLLHSHAPTQIEYYGLFAMVFFTCKLITAFVLCISAEEIFPSFVFESKVVAFLLIACFLAWIAIVIFYSKILE